MICGFTGVICREERVRNEEHEDAFRCVDPVDSDMCSDVFMYMLSSEDLT